MNQHQYCVIMAGGGGSRFWPLTRENRPKQFIDLDGGGKSFVRAAYERCSEVVPPDRILVVTLEKFKGLVTDQIPEIPAKNILLEPYSRQTAPCIAWATYTILLRDPEAVIAVTPSDNRISNSALFADTLRSAFDYAGSHPVLLALGIRPDRPDTNYGYIQVTGGSKAIHEGVPVKVKTFVEKPSEGLAEVFCNSGEFLWNSGIFIWKASTIKEEMERHIPKITSLFNGWESTLGTPAEKVFIERVYTDCSRLSIDYGVMEKTEIAWVCPASFDWKDIDSWDSLYNNVETKDARGNLSNTENVSASGSCGNVFLVEGSQKLIAVEGLEDFIVVDTPDVLLICPRNDKKYRDFTASFWMSGYEKYK